MTSEAGPDTAGMHHLDLSHAVWRKSSRSQGQGNNCVEVARVDNYFALRDSKNLQDTPLIINWDEWNAFLNEVKRGDLDPR